METNYSNYLKKTFYNHIKNNPNCTRTDLRKALSLNERQCAVLANSFLGDELIERTESIPHRYTLTGKNYRDKSNELFED